MFGTSSAYGLPMPLLGTHYCGYVVKQDPVRRAREIRRTLRRPRRRYVFVSAGGGGDAQLLMRTYVQAVRLLGSDVDFATLMAVGVNAPSGIPLELEAAAQGLPIRIVPYVDDKIGRASCRERVYG